MLLLYSFPPQISHPAGIWKSFSSPRQDLGDQCCQISRLFTSTACSDLQVSLCESCDCSCWRQCAGVLRETGLHCFYFMWLSCLFCHISFSDFCCCCCSPSLVLLNSQSLLISVSCGLGPLEVLSAGSKDVSYRVTFGFLCSGCHRCSLNKTPNTMLLRIHPKSWNSNSPHLPRHELI